MTSKRTISVMFDGMVVPPVKKAMRGTKKRKSLCLLIEINPVNRKGRNRGRLSHASKSDVMRHPSKEIRSMATKRKRKTIARKAPARRKAPAQPKAQPRSVKWYGWKPDTPDHRDHTFKMAARGLDPIHFLPAQFMPAIRDQGNQGSCTGHMAYGMAHYVDAYCGGKTKLLSPGFAYWNARYLEGSTREDSGAEIRDAIKGVVKFGIATEALCRYNPRSFKTKPSDSAFRNAKTEMITDYQRIADGAIGDGRNDLYSIKAAIAGDFPVGFGFSVYANFDGDRTAQQGILGMPDGELEGGHAVWICGYDDGYKIDNETGAVLIANSWGTDWGCKPPGYKSRGYFWMPYAYLTNRNLCDDFWVCRRIT